MCILNCFRDLSIFLFWDYHWRHIRCILGPGLKSGIVDKRSKFTILVSDTIGVFNILIEVRGPYHEFCGERIVSLHQAKSCDSDANGLSENIKYLEDCAGRKLLVLFCFRLSLSTCCCNSFFKVDSHWTLSFELNGIKKNSKICSKKHTCRIPLWNMYFSASSYTIVFF